MRSKVLHDTGQRRGEWHVRRYQDDTDATEQPKQVSKRIHIALLRAPHNHHVTGAAEQALLKRMELSMGFLAR